MIKVRFFDVGREKLSWIAELEPTGPALVRAVKHRGALMSRDFEVTLDLETGKGFVLVGAARVVGHLEVVREAAPEAERVAADAP